jgi:hypothetical protein
MPLRFVLEGTWTGYTSNQMRVCHREVVRDRKRIERLKALHKIVYTDGTALLIHIREAVYREKIREIFSYRDLIRQAETKGGNVVSVSDLLS